MATLKGQNFRILRLQGTTLNVIGMATNCVVTLQNNTEESTTKDDVGMASKPTVTSKSWQVQVESLNVVDAGAMLTAMKSMTPFILMWDETNTTNNQGRVKASYARRGTAYLSDLTLTFNDRENSAKNLQFSGASALETVSSSLETTVISAGSYTKGQFVRLFLSSDNTTTPSGVIAAAKQLQMHISMQMETETTKDTDGEWDIQEPVALSYDITTNALVRGGDTITASGTAQTLANVESIYEAGTPVKWQIANVSGANQRTKGSVIVSGSCILQQLTINAANRQSAAYDAQLSGYGEYTVGA